MEGGNEGVRERGREGGKEIVGERGINQRRYDTVTSRAIIADCGPIPVNGILYNIC